MLAGRLISLWPLALCVIGCQGDGRVQLPDTGIARSSSGLVAFVRATPGRLVPTALGKEQATELWIADAHGANARRLVVGRGDDTVQRALADFHSPVFSPDGRVVYFLSRAWVTSDAVHAVDVATGAEHFVTGGNTLAVIPSGPFAGCLLVAQHRYFRQGGSYDWTWLITPSGREVGLAASDSVGSDQRLEAWLRGDAPADFRRSAPVNERCN